MAIQNFLSSTVSEDEYMSEGVSRGYYETSKGEHYLNWLTGSGTRKTPLQREIYGAQHALNETMYEVSGVFPDAVLDVHNMTVTNEVQGENKILAIPIMEENGVFVGYVAYEIMPDKTMKPIAIPDSKGVLRRSGGVVSTRAAWQNYEDIASNPQLIALEGRLHLAVSIDDTFSRYGQNLFAPGNGANLSVKNAADMFGPRAAASLGKGASQDDIVDFIIDHAVMHGWNIFSTNEQDAMSTYGIDR